MPRMMHAASCYGGSPHIFIATPAATLHGNYLFALARSLPVLQREGIAVDYCLLMEHCHVDDARNALVAEFLKSKATHLVFIDADIGWNPEDLLHLCRHDRDIVAGIYPLKNPGEEAYPIRMKPGEAIYSDADGLVECEGLPTGFMKISRHAINLMIEAWGDKKFRSKDHSPNDPPMSILFERTYEDFQRFSGDYAFCRKWLAIGRKLYCDPEMSFSHEGQYEFTGSLGSYWKRAHGVTADEALDKMGKGIAQLKSGDASAKTLNLLSDGWSNAASAKIELLAACWEMAHVNDGPVLELGCGLSTIILALANPANTVHAIENDPVWASKLNYFLEKHGIANVKVHWSPIVKYDAGKWYDIRRIPAESYALVLCDGPWRSLGDRHMLLSLVSAMIDRAVIIMDDVDGDHAYGATIAKWASANSRNALMIGQSHKFVVSTPLGKAAE